MFHKKELSNSSKNKRLQKILSLIDVNLKGRKKLKLYTVYTAFSEHSVIFIKILI